MCIDFIIYETEDLIPNIKKTNCCSKIKLLTSWHYNLLKYFFGHDFINESILINSVLIEIITKNALAI